MPKREQISFRCPECDYLGCDTILTGSSVVVICARCANVIERTGLLAGEDGVRRLPGREPD
jgi:ribosomal protein S27E